jgi:hypothetical protein
MKSNEITLTMTKKQLKSIVSLMGIALDTDCKAINSMSDKQIENLMALREVLQMLYITPKKGTAEWDFMYDSDVRAHS